MVSEHTYIAIVALENEQRESGKDMILISYRSKHQLLKRFRNKILAWQ